MIRDKELHHENIIEAATKEFLQYGFVDASMRRIASLSKMSVAGLYKHFASKEEMFCAVVEPVLFGLLTLYKNEDESEDIIENIDPSMLDNSHEARRAMEYIYDNFEVFQLIVCKSKGTQYEDFLHKIAVLEEEATLSFMEKLKKQGVPIRDYSKKELHLLTTANMSAIFQAVEHGFSREEAFHYADTLDRFFSKAWKEFFGY
ncbi:MAG: TetR/AcrR family transcriptional regulator [Clostridia bacterium]|nr:TetR/AcrR family transcriptional regulator [Clostridia bacterium]